MTLDRELVYLLAECPQCGRRYAALPDPYRPGQWEVMHRDTLGHSHTVIDQPLLCVACVGVSLVRAHPAVQTGRGWLAVAADLGKGILS